MMKNNLPLWVIAVSITIILISIPVQEAYTAGVVAFQADGSITTATDAITACFDVADVDNIGDLTTVTNWSIDGNALTGGTVTFVNGACGTNNNDGVTITGMSETFNTAATPAVELANINLEHPVGQNTQTNPINIVLTDGAPPTFVSATTTSSTSITVTYSEAVVSVGAELGDYTFGGIDSAPTTTAIAGSGCSFLARIE